MMNYGGGYGSMLQAHGPLGMNPGMMPRPGLGGSDRMIPGQGFGGGLMNPQPQMGGRASGSAGGWLNAIKESLGDLDPFEQMYLGAQAVGGVANWWERKGERNEDKRRYEEQMERGRNHRQKMGQSWQSVLG